jgi:hypothetical protein
MGTKIVRERENEGWDGSNPEFIPLLPFYLFYLDFNWSIIQNVKTVLFFEFCSASLPDKICAPSITGKI